MLSISLRWDNPEKTVLIYAFPANWTWQDFYQVKEQADKMLDDVPHNVVLVFDMTQTLAIPTSAISQARSLIDRAHPRGKPIILVGTNLVIRALLGLVSKFNPRTEELILAVTTLEEARSWVAKNRPSSSLPPQ